MLCSPVAVFSQIRSAWPTAGVGFGDGFGVGLGEDEGGAAVKRPKTPTEFVVPTNTLPLQIVGVINLLASPNRSRCGT
jgi:hypothetical protein